MECIDAHHHLWKYSPEDYPWMSDKMEVLRHDYLLPELEAITTAAGVTGTVVVQAQQTLAETEWMLSLAKDSQRIRGVVGWAPLVEPKIEACLEEIARHPKLKGLRHILQDEADDRYMLRNDFNRGIACLQQFDLRYDLLVFERHLLQTIEFVDRHPKQIFILDHIAKPLIREQAMEPWRSNLRELARRENVYCKLSGMTTEADWSSWSEQQLWPYMETVLSAFGAERLMFGSDWPVLNLASDYTAWIELVRRAIAKLSPDEQEQILAKTAIEAYGL
ncbi:amidohydrolase family protein [Granulicella mallensis]|uniref:Amidohydrolase 2 n=1 Tax=Granulicella mallensis (strain ATCC BAA-1857 / DSM 23137 / MP5ACTX8) TaxID=682795 RepID=G8NZ69_GRAMM|nr:amidohydrolase family protein [Granulicella mallensis]AEU36805.1 amidohydrolase 2 [Granulicella mallensis MP5ACTX8]